MKSLKVAKCKVVKMKDDDEGGDEGCGEGGDECS